MLKNTYIYMNFTHTSVLLILYNSLSLNYRRSHAVHNSSAKCSQSSQPQKASLTRISSLLSYLSHHSGAQSRQAGPYHQPFSHCDRMRRFQVLPSFSPFPFPLCQNLIWNLSQEQLSSHLGGHDAVLSCLGFKPQKPAVTWVQLHNRPCLVLTWRRWLSLNFKL